MDDDDIQELGQCKSEATAIYVLRYRRLERATRIGNDSKGWQRTVNLVNRLSENRQLLPTRGELDPQRHMACWKYFNDFVADMRKTDQTGFMKRFWEKPNTPNDPEHIRCIQQMFGTSAEYTPLCIFQPDEEMEPLPEASQQHLYGWDVWGEVATRFAMLTADAEHAPTIIAARSSNNKTRIIAVALWYMYVCGMKSEAIIFKNAWEQGQIAPPTGNECAITDMHVLNEGDSELEFKAKKKVTGVDLPSIEKQICINAGALEDKPHITQAEPWFTLVIHSGRGIDEILTDLRAKVTEYKKQEAIAFLAGEPKKFRAIQIGWQLNEITRKGGTKTQHDIVPPPKEWTKHIKELCKLMEFFDVRTATIGGDSLQWEVPSDFDLRRRCGKMLSQLRGTDTKRARHVQTSHLYDWRFMALP
jgi:hypothetical protein